MMILMVLGAVLIFLGILVGIMLLIFTMPVIFNLIENNELLQNLFLKIKNFDNQVFPFSLFKLKDNLLENIIIHSLIAIAIFSMIFLGLMVSLQLCYRKRTQYLNRFFRTSFILSIIVVVLLTTILIFTGMWWLSFILITISIGSYFLQYFFINYTKKMLITPSSNDDKIIYDQPINNQQVNNDFLSSKNIYMSACSVNNLKKIMQSSENLSSQDSFARKKVKHLQEMQINNDKAKQIFLKEKDSKLNTDIENMHHIGTITDSTKEKEDKIKLDNNEESEREFTLKTFLPKNNIQDDAITDKKIVNDLKAKSIIQKEGKEQMVVDANKVYYHSQSSGKTIEISRELTQKFLFKDVEIDSAPTKPVDLEKPEYDYIPTDEDLKKPHKKIPKTKKLKNDFNSLDIIANNRITVNSQAMQSNNKIGEELLSMKQNSAKLPNTSQKEHYHLQYPNHTFATNDCPICLRNHN